MRGAHVCLCVSSSFLFQSKRWVWIRRSCLQVTFHKAVEPKRQKPNAFMQPLDPRDEGLCAALGVTVTQEVLLERGSRLTTASLCESGTTRPHRELFTCNSATGRNLREFLILLSSSVHNKQASS